jgi:hypothetical protein
MGSKANQKLEEAEYFLKETHRQFNARSGDFVFSLNAFVNAARNVTFVMQSEYARKPGFKEWWAEHPIRQDKSLARFIELRNISLKQGSVTAKTFMIKHDFGPKGLHVVGMKGPTSVVSDPIRFDGPIPDHSYVTVDDDNGHRRVRVDIVHDFSIVEHYDHGKKSVHFDNFIKDAGVYMDELAKIVEESDLKFAA